METAVDSDPGTHSTKDMWPLETVRILSPVPSGLNARSPILGESRLSLLTPAVSK